LLLSQLGGNCYLLTRFLESSQVFSQLQINLLPVAAYTILAGSAFAARSHAHEALFGVAAAALLLLFDGIHNAWDGIAYHVFVKKRGQTKG